MKECTLYKKLKEKTVQCRACRNYCVIDDGKTGLCGVRKNEKGKLFLLVYGKAIAAHVDPVEKKPLFHFLPGEKIFSIGTIGCNFSCKFCQNWDISQASKEMSSEVVPSWHAADPAGKDEDWEPEKIIDYCLKNKIKAIAFTYNEPTIFFEYAYDTAKLAKENNIKTVFVSNGYCSKESLKMIKPYLDALNVDLKAMNREFYENICNAKLEQVLDSIKLIHEMGFWLELTTLLVPGKNDKKEEIEKIAKFIFDLDPEMPWHISAFHPDYRMLDVPQTSLKKLFEAHETAKKIGLKNVYIGNYQSVEYESTYCPKCKRRAIERSGYDILEINMKNGNCSYCGERILGVWK